MKASMIDRARGLTATGLLVATMLPGCVGSITAPPGGGARAADGAVAKVEDGLPTDAAEPSVDGSTYADASAAARDAAVADTWIGADGVTPHADVAEQPEPATADAPSADGSTGDMALSAGDAGNGAASCPAADLAERMGLSHLLVGGRMDDAQFAEAAFDLRYRYLSDEIPTDGPCESCAAGCVVAGQDCSNDGPGCPWWGCWQSDTDPPGQYVVSNIAKAEAAGAVPMFSYYIWYYVAGSVEGAPEIAALADGDKIARYLADWRFACQRVAEATSGPVILHVEPDLWGFGNQVNSDPDAIPAAVSAAAAPECAGLPDSMAGLARCMLAIARALAPSAVLGFHGSSYGAGADALHEDDPAFDIDAHADETAAFMTALGAADADLVVFDMTNADAGKDGRWWDATNATIPNFSRGLGWAGRVADHMGLPYLWWQVPFGNMGLDDHCLRYRDNRVDYFFDRPHEFAASGALGIAFGAALDCTTTPANDDGHFVTRASDHFAAPRPCPCDVCP
jgi:hypothetical protein